MWTKKMRWASRVASTSYTRLGRTTSLGGARSTGVGTVGADDVWAPGTLASSGSRMGASDQELRTNSLGPGRHYQRATHTHSSCHSGFDSRVEAAWCPGAPPEEGWRGMRRPFSCATCSCGPSDDPFGHGRACRSEDGDRLRTRNSAQIQLQTGRSLVQTWFWQERYSWVVEWEA